MDLDATVRGFDLTHESAESAFREIIAIPSGNDWRFEFDRTEDIRETRSPRHLSSTTIPCCSTEGPSG